MFSDMNIQTVLDLLETARFLCIDPLVEGIEKYLKYLLDSKKVAFTDCLVALDFSILHKFTTASSLFLSYIDQNVFSISSLPEFAVLSESGMHALLKYEGRCSSEIVLFRAFAKWVENKESLPADVKNEMVCCFDINLFDKTDLMKTVRKTNFFDDKDICDVLEKHIENLEDILSLKANQIEAQKEKNEAQKQQNVVQNKKIEEQNKQVEEQRIQIEEQKKHMDAQAAQARDMMSIISHYAPLSNWQ